VPATTLVDARGTPQAARNEEEHRADGWTNGGNTNSAPPSHALHGNTVALRDRPEVDEYRRSVWPWENKQPRSQTARVENAAGRPPNAGAAVSGRSAIVMKSGAAKPPVSGTSARRP